MQHDSQSDFNVYLTKFSTRFDPLFTTGTRLSSLISDRVVATKKWLTFQGFVIAEVDCCNHAMAGSLEVIVPIVHICTGGDCTYCPYPYRIWLYLLSISVLELIVPVVHICARPQVSSITESEFCTDKDNTSPLWLVWLVNPPAFGVSCQAR